MVDSPLRVLLIDDDEDSYVLTRSLLRQIKHTTCELEWVDQYDAGLQRILQAQHDVCLLDYRLGARDGVELLRQAITAGCQAPIIMLTGEGDSDVDRYAMQAGAMDYLLKDELAVDSLERCIRHAQERQRLLNALKTAADDLARSNQELQQFAYVASHDLQAPLRRVMSWCEMLQLHFQGQHDAEADEYIGEIVRSANAMQRLIRDLLALAKVGMQDKRFESTDCERIVDHALKNLEVALQESGAAITRDPLPTVLADPTQLLQLFQNLIGNAIAYRGEAPPRIHVSAERRADQWLFRVQDNGIGIDPKNHRDIFIIFKRLHSDDQYQGTGIGLALCKRIVERHGGQIWVESQLGQGSVFHFTLSAAQSATPDPPASPENRP
jgi:signal transduction histidine kinase